MKRRTFIASAAATMSFALHPALAEDVQTENLVISGAFSRANPKTAMAGAGFMIIRSLGEADRLIGFTSPACNRPELHTHINDNGIMRMREVEAIDVPAGGEARLEPGGLHLMFIDLNQQFVEGESLEATLIFEKAGEVPITLVIKGPGAMN